jgi:hypothetical protein
MQSLCHPAFKLSPVTNDIIIGNVKVNRCPDLRRKNDFLLQAVLFPATKS